jgi:Na+-transporting NADH:ubiquinone oxidoreductase subunit NqrD
MVSALDKQNNYNQKLGKAAAQTSTTTKKQAVVTSLALSVLIGISLYFVLARSDGPSR